MSSATRSGSLSHRVATHLQAAITTGALNLGESLSEDGIAEALGVSRTPVREALQLLQARGLVQIVPKSGTYVFEPTEEQIVELCEFRFTMELRAATWAFERQRDAAAAALNNAVAAMSTAIDGRDMTAYARADTTFHQVFFENCENTYLKTTYTMSLAQVAALRTHLAAQSEGEPMRSFGDHKSLRDVFASGEKDEIETILRPHILRTRENYTNTLRRRAALQQESRLDHLRRVFHSSDTSAEAG